MLVHCDKERTTAATETTTTTATSSTTTSSHSIYNKGQGEQQGNPAAPGGFLADVHVEGYTRLGGQLPGLTGYLCGRCLEEHGEQVPVSKLSRMICVIPLEES